MNNETKARMYRYVVAVIQGFLYPLAASYRALRKSRANCIQLSRPIGVPNVAVIQKINERPKGIPRKR